MDGSHYGLTTEDSLYYRYNSTMRGRISEEVELWADYSHIIDSALRKLPSREVTVYRGFHVSLTQVSHEFKPGKVVWLVSVTSATTDEKHTLKFFGSGSSSSPGTLMKIHALSAKDIKAFSVVPTESELVFSLNTCLSIERVITSQELMSLKGLIEDLPENVDLIVARQQRDSEAAVTSAIAQDAEDAIVFQSQNYASSQSGGDSLAVLSSSASAFQPAATASSPVTELVLVSPSLPSSAFHPASPASLPHTLDPSAPTAPLPSLPPSSSRSFSSSPAPQTASPTTSPVSFSDALSSLKSVVSDEAAAAIAYYDGVDFAAQLCDDAATQHGTNYALSVPLQEACISLRGILASKPLLIPSKVTVTSVLSDAESVLQADPGLQAARQKIKDACDREEQQMRADVSQSEKVCQNIMVKLQADELDARSSATNDLCLLEKQLGVDATRIDGMNDEESRALAARDFKSAQVVNARLKAYVAECLQSVLAATSKRKLELEQQLLQLRAVASDATAAGQRVVSAKRTILEAAVTGHRNQLQEFDASSASFPSVMSRARELLGRKPAWPRHEALLRFDLPLQRLTTQFISKKWFQRFFCLRGRLLYHSDGKNGHSNTQDGTLAFVRSNPEPDCHYCVDVKGMSTLLMYVAVYHKTLLCRLLCYCLPCTLGRTGLRV